MFWKTMQILEKNTCDKVKVLRACSSIKEDSKTSAFLWNLRILCEQLFWSTIEFYELFKNLYFPEDLQTLALKHQCWSLSLINLQSWRPECIYIYIYIYTNYKRDYLCETSLKTNVATDEGKDRNETWTLDKEMKLEWLYKAGSESELNSWPDSSVG